jgi:hypothetical protein
VRALGGAATAALLVVAASSCTHSSGRSPDHRAPASGNTSFAGVTGVVWTDPNSAGTVVYTNTTMRLFDGCTNMRTALRMEHGALVQGKPIGKTGLCTGTISLPGPQAAAGRARQQRLDHFYAVVAGPASWSVAGDVLTLATPGKGSVQLATNGQPAPMLSGTRWRLAWYTGTDAFGRGARQHLDLTVRSSGSFTARLSCGALTGTARLFPARIRSIKVSRTSCTERPNPASRVVLAVFKAGQANYAIRGTQLMVYGDGGRLLVYKSAGALTPAVRECRRADVAARFVTAGRATGNDVGVIVIRNASASPCRVDGNVSFSAVNVDGSLDPAAGVNRHVHADAILRARMPAYRDGRSQRGYLVAFVQGPEFGCGDRWQTPARLRLGVNHLTLIVANRDAQGGRGIHGCHGRVLLESIGIGR